MTCVENARDDSGSARRDEATQEIGATSHGHAGDVHVVLDGQRLA